MDTIITTRYCIEGFKLIKQAQGLESYFEAVALKAAQKVFGTYISKAMIDCQTEFLINVSFYDKFRGEEDIHDAFSFKPEDFASVEEFADVLKKKHEAQIALKEALENDISNQETKERYGI